MNTSIYNMQIASLLDKLNNLIIGNYFELTRNTRSKSAFNQAKQIKKEFNILIIEMLNASNRNDSLLVVEQ